MLKLRLYRADNKSVNAHSFVPKASRLHPRDAFDISTPPDA